MNVFKQVRWSSKEILLSSYKQYHSSIPYFSETLHPFCIGLTFMYNDRENGTVNGKESGAKA